MPLITHPLPTTVPSAAASPNWPSLPRDQRTLGETPRMSPPPLGQQPGKWTEGPERITTMGAVFILQEETKLPFSNAARAASPTPWCFLCILAWTLCGDIYPLSPGDSESQLSASVGRPPTLPSQGLRYRPLPSLGHRAAWPCCPWCSSVAFARHFRALSLPRVPPP